MEHLDCLFIGSVTKDIMMHLADVPQRDSRVLVDRVCITGGGIAGTSASAFTKLGGKAGIISAIGDDEAGEFASDFLRSGGIAYSSLIKIEGKSTPFSSILVEPDGKRLIAFYGGCIGSLTLDMIDKEALKNSGIIHIGGLPEDFLAELVKYVKSDLGKTVSVDGGNLSKECIDRILPYTDIFIPDNKTVSRAVNLPYEDACRYFCHKGAGTVCITLGEKGSIALYNGEFYSAPPVSAKVMDTTGAGDNFHGAFLYCVKQGFSMDKTLKFCNAFSGLCCEALGGPSSEPTLEETLLKAQEEYGEL